MMKKMRYVMASVMTVVGLMLPLTHAQDGGWSEVNQVENAWSQVGQAPASNTSSKDGWGGVVESGSGNPSTNANDAGDGGGGNGTACRPPETRWEQVAFENGHTFGNCLWRFVCIAAGATAYYGSASSTDGGPPSLPPYITVGANLVAATCVFTGSPSCTPTYTYKTCLTEYTYNMYGTNCLLSGRRELYCQ
jgi:hypothetical protein